jgi:hypothetical protein
MSIPICLTSSGFKFLNSNRIRFTLFYGTGGYDSTIRQSHAGASPTALLAAGAASETVH